MKRTALSLFIGAFLTSPALAEAVYTFDDVVVSATRTEQESGDIASSVGVVDRKELDKRLVQDIKSAVQHEPGVQLQGQGRFGASGFNIRGRDDNYVKVLVDGVEQASGYNPSGGAMQKSSVGTLEVDTLKRLEINKGPVSSLYGSDALAGAVLMTTLDPDDLLESESSHFSVKTGYQSVDESIKATTKWAGQSDHWQGLLIYTHRQGHETQTHGSGADIEGRDRGQADPLDTQRDNFLGKLYFLPDEHHRIGVTVEHFQSQANGDVLSNNGYTMMPGYTYTDNLLDDANRRQRVSLSHDWQIDHKFFDDVHWQLSWQESEVENNTFDTTGAKGKRQRQRIGKDDSWQGQWQFNKSLLAKTSEHLLSYGASVLKQSFALDYQDIALDSNTVTPKNPEVPNAKSLKWGAYVQHQGFFSDDRLITNAAVRFDAFTAEPQGNEAFDSSDENAWTGKLGAVYHLSDRWSAFGQFSQGFKAPTLYDMYYQYSMGQTILPNPDLRPERSDAFELGSRWQSDAGRASLTAFYHFYDDFIEQVTVGQDDKGDVKQNVNIAKAKIYGVEFASHWDLNAVLSAPEGSYLKLSAAYAKGENSDDGKPLDSVAPLSGSVTLGFDALDAHFGSALTVQGVAGKSGGDWSNENNLDAAGYAVVDLTGYYRPMADLTVRGGLFNALDKKYWHYSDLEGVTKTEGLDRRTQAGRNWGIEVEYQF